MTHISNKKLYEDFHAKTSIHSKIINSHDYTHGPIIGILNRYTQTDQKILDVGCGTGSLDFYLAINRCQVTGIDISQRAISSCIRDAERLGVEKNVRFEVSTIEKFKTRKKFDLILCIEVIEHIKKDQDALDKMYDLLDKGGILILSTPSTNAPLYRIGFLKEFENRVGHLRRYSMASITSKVTNSGFKIIESHKSEGIVRNFLFTSTIGGKLILKLVNRSTLLKNVVETLDAICLKHLGESDLVLICTKPPK